MIPPNTKKKKKSSFSLSLLAGKQQCLKEMLTITRLCFSFMPAAFIWSPPSSRSDKRCSLEMSSHTLSIWVSFEEIPSTSKQFVAHFQWFLSSAVSHSFSLFDKKVNHKCQRTLYGIFPPRQHILRRCFVMTNALKV